MHLLLMGGGGGGVSGRGGGGGGVVFLPRPLFFFGNGSGSGSGVAGLSSSEEDISLPLLRFWLEDACFPFLLTFTSSPTEKEKLQHKEETQVMDRKG